MNTEPGLRLERMKTLLRSSGATAFSFLALVCAVIVFWKIQVVGPGQTPSLFYKTIDLYTEHYPMVWYGFKQLASGSLPLWNPYQLCGIPFLAVPHTGLLYPGNLPYLFLDTGIAIEVVYVAHTIFAGWMLWLLTRDFGMGALASLAGAFTFIWSVWIFNNLNQPAIHVQMCLLPVTILMIERTMRRERWAFVGLILVMACQVLAGATEIMVFNLYAGALYTILRIGELLATGRPRDAIILGLEVLGCVVAGVALAAPQLFSSLELVMEGVRSGGLSLQEQRLYGRRPVSNVVLAFFSTAGAFLPFLLLGLGVRVKSHRVLWVFGLLVVLIAGLMSGGGALYEAYAATPLGKIFRYPEKFYHLYNFGLAIVAAAGVDALLSMKRLRGRSFWTDRFWLLNGAIAIGMIAFFLQRKTPPTQAIVLLGLVLAFAAIPQRIPRIGIAFVILGLHAYTLFIPQTNRHARPFADPSRFERHRATFESLLKTGSTDRTYISPRLRLSPALTLKQGMMNELQTTGDYEPLSTERHARYFDAAAGPSLNSKTVISRVPSADARRTRFVGYHLLNADSDWRLMDMASTRYFLTSMGDEVDVVLYPLSMNPNQTGIRRASVGSLRVYENGRRLPRAFVVSGVEIVDGEERALEAISRPNFNPRTTVLIEDGKGSGVEDVQSDAPLEAARIIEYEAERVVVEFETNRPGYLVLTDAYYPGWHARVGTEATEILRANYLFRAVPVSPGKSIVTFEYAPWSFRAGVTLSATTAFGLGALVIYRRRRELTVSAST